ncbi:MAG: hypothetical protein V4494_03770 [Chlamydiota bacterium]
MNAHAKPRHIGRIGLILICSLGLCCYFLRYDLLVFGFDFFLKRQVSKHFSHSVTYESVHWKEGKLVALGVNLSDEHFHLTVDLLELDWTIDWSNYYIEPHIRLTHPELTLVHHKERAGFPLTLAPLIPGKYLGMKVEIQHGVLQLNTHDSEQRLYFSFKSGNTKEHLGDFYLSHDPDLFALPTSELSFGFQDAEIVASLKVGQMESARLVQLLSFFYPVLREGWENVQGEVEVMMSGTFSPDFSFSRLAGLIDAKDVYLSNPLLSVQMQAKALHGEFTFPPHEESKSADPFWKQIRACGTIEEGDWILGDGGIKNISAHLLLDPFLDPVLDLSGIWIQNHRQVPLTMQGKGCMHEDQSFWLEMGVRMTPPDEEISEALISVCSGEKESYVVQVELKHLDVALLEMFAITPPSVRASAEGKLTGWIEGNSLIKLQIDDFHAESVTWRFPEKDVTCCTDLIHGEALFSRSKNNAWQMISLKADIPEFILVGKDFLFPSLNVHMSGEGSTLSTVFSFQDESIETHFDFQKSQGWLRSENLTELSYAGLVGQLCKDVHLEGEFAIFGTFNTDKIFLSLQGQEILIDHPMLTFHTKEMVQSALFNYSFSDEKWQGAWSLQNASMIAKESQLHFDHVSASLELDGMIFEAKDIIAACKEIQFAGSFNVDLENKIFCLTSSHLEGYLAPLSQLLDLKLPINGIFSSGEDGLALVSKAGSIDWRLKAQLQNVEMNFKKEISLSDGLCELNFDSKTGTLVLSNVDAVLEFRGKSYRLMGYAKKKEWWEFDAQVTGGHREIARVVGIAQERPPAELHFAFEKNKTHLLGTKLSISRLIIKDWTEILALEMNPLFPAGRLVEYANFFGELDLLPFKDLALNLQGDIEARVAFEEQLNFEATAPLLSIEGKSFHDCSLKGNKENNIWSIEQLSARHFSLDGIIIQQSSALHCTGLNLRTDQLSLIVEGDYTYDNNAFMGRFRSMKFNVPGVSIEGEGVFSCAISEQKAEGEFSFFAETDNYEAHSKRSVKGIFTKEQGLSFSDIALHIQKKNEENARLNCLAEHVTYNGEKILGKKLHIDLSREAIFEFSPKCAHLIPENGELDLEYTPKTSVLKAGCKTNLGMKPLYFQLQLDHSEEILGMLKISDGPKNAGIKCLFKSDFQWESIQGKIPGLDINLLKKSEQMFWGEVKADFSLLTNYLPEKQRLVFEEIDFMSEVELEGSLDIDAFQFQGALKSNRFDCFGISFQELQGAIKLSQKECLIENMTLEDPSCHILVKQAMISHDTEWKCHIPLILVSNFQPSLLKRKAAPESKVNPFIIKKLSLYDIEGILGNRASFTARGRLNFTNHVKKEFSILEIPLEMIKNLGLDSGLFTPIYGEMEFQMLDGKFIVTDLMNTYSEGKRSEFYLPEHTTSYLDLNGNLNFDLKMKQNVLLNITEPFTLSIRGDVTKPKYSLVK